MILREMASKLFAAIGARNSVDIWVSNELSANTFHVSIRSGENQDRVVSGRVRYIGYSTLPAECIYVESGEGRGVKNAIDDETVCKALLCTAFLIFNSAQAEKGHALTVHKSGFEYRMSAPVVQYKDFVIAGDSLYKVQ